MIYTDLACISNLLDIEGIPYMYIPGISMKYIRCISMVYHLKYELVAVSTWYYIPSIIKGS